MKGMDLTAMQAGALLYLSDEFDQPQVIGSRVNADEM
jgi:hypothetical protein